jgi:pSer/pThr/pTyr-binding forkhead associated (FHA) protein
MPRLVAQSPEFTGKSFELSGPEITVGRLEDNKIQLEHASVSGHHAMLTLDEQDYVLKDLDSTNGSRINGEKVSSQKLRRNDMVRFGNIEVLYDSEHQPPGRPMPSLSERVNLAECATKGHPAGFTNASPIKKRERGKEKTKWPIAIAILTVLAVAGIGYFVWRVFINPPMLS